MLGPAEQVRSHARPRPSAAKTACRRPRTAVHPTLARETCSSAPKSSTIQRLVYACALLSVDDDDDDDDDEDVEKVLRFMALWQACFTGAYESPEECGTSSECLDVPSPASGCDSLSCPGGLVCAESLLDPQVGFFLPPLFTHNCPDSLFPPPPSTYTSSNFHACLVF